MTKAVIYARYSSDNQREESITAQIRACKEYASKNSIKIVNIFKDEAKSGKYDNREEFLNMIDASKMGLWEVVLVHKKDRFARNRYDHAFYKRELQKAGVRLISVTEKFDDSPESVLLESLVEGMSEYYSKNLAREVMKGMKENAYQCLHNGGVPPLGYDVNEKKEYIINEHEAKAVRLIFDMFIKGVGYGKIMQTLNIRGFTTKRGNRFSKNGLYEILRNEKYAGIYVFNKAPSRDFEGKRNAHAKKNENEIIRVKNGVPAIISPEIFKEAQQLMDRNRKNRACNTAKETYILTGKIYCGECGSSMVGNSSTVNGIRYAYYECNKRTRTKECNNKRIQKNFAEANVLETIERDLFSEAKIAELTKKINDYIKKQTEDKTILLKELYRQQKDIAKKLDNLVKMVENGLGSKTIAEKISAYEKGQERIDFEIAEIEATKPQIFITEYMIKNFLEKNKRDIQQKNLAECKAIIDKYIDKITVTGEEITVSMILDIAGVGGPYRMVSKIQRASVFGY